MTKWYSHPTTDEQISFGPLTLAVANGKAAELRISGYTDVVISIAKQPPETTDGHGD
jgi:hypothetical protein